MQQEKNKFFKFILPIIYTCILTFVCFLILGTFYRAVEQSVGLNILAWASTVIAAYYLYFLTALLLSRIFKKFDKPKIYNGWAILSGLFLITVICLFNSSEIDDYLFVEIMGLISGIFGTFQIIFELVLKKR
jgi:hypothetical protein